MTTAVQVQYRRGTSSQVAAFTGAAGEMVVDTTNNRAVVQDGATAGGFPAAKLAEVITNARTQVSDGDYTALTSDRTVAYVALSAARIVSLPAAAGFPTGTRLLVMDESGGCSASNTITLAANGADTIDGAASAVIDSAYGYLALQSDGSSKWTIVDQVGGGGGGGGSGTVNAGTAGQLAYYAATGSAVSGAAPATFAGGGGLNKFRNAHMDVAQRGTSGSVSSASTAYTLDGWMIAAAGANAAWGQQYNQNLAGNALRISCVSGLTACTLQQRIESFIAAELLAGDKTAQPVTVQFAIYNNTGAAITPQIAAGYASTQDGFGTVTSDLAATNLQSIANGSVGSVAYTFTPSANLANGYQIELLFGGALNAATGHVDVSLADFRATAGVPTGQNGSPPPPELRPIVYELAFCQRYFASSFANGTTPANDASPYVYTFGGAFATAQFGTAVMSFPVQMRASPTLTFYSAAVGTPTNGQWSYYSGAWTAGTNTRSAAGGLTVNGLSVNIDGSYTTGYSYIAAGNYTASAEL